MNSPAQSIVRLAETAHRILQSDSGYIQNKALISGLFRLTRSFSGKEEVRLTLVDSLYSTNVATKRLYGISDIAGKLRGAFRNDDAEVKKTAAQWVESGFANENPLYALFAAGYGIDKFGEEGKAAVSLLSKYLYFVTDYSFPIYDSLGAKYHYIVPVTLPRQKDEPEFRRRFVRLEKINREYAVNDFDKLDALFWLCGKVYTGSYSLVLSKERYVRLLDYLKPPPSEKTDPYIKTKIDEHIHGSGSPLTEILGKEFYEFIQQIQTLMKE
jgi:hypothetical protein